MRLAGTARQTWNRFRGRRARVRAVQEFHRSLALIVDREALESSVATRLKEIFDPDRLAILRLDPRDAHYRVSFSSGLANANLSAMRIPAQGRLARWFTVNETCLSLPRESGVLRYLDESEREVLTALEVQLCAPLMSRSHVTGMVLLGSDREHHFAARQDAELLRALTEQASLAFQNATLYHEQQERLERLHRADRLAAIGQLAAGVAHEVRNPLTSIRSTIQYLGRSFGDGDPKQELAQELLEEVDRINSTISELLNLTRASELVPSEVDLVELMEQTVRLIDIQARKQSVEIKLDYSPRKLLVHADGSQLKQVFLNLILNALQAMPKGGRIALTATLERLLSGAREEPFVHVRVTDNGPGIPAERLERVFDPFFTTKQEGTGLGLLICQNIVERHKGELEMRSVEGEGTEVSIFLPAAA